MQVGIKYLNCITTLAAIAKSTSNQEGDKLNKYKQGILEMEEILSSNTQPEEQQQQNTPVLNSEAQTSSLTCKRISQQAFGVFDNIGVYTSTLMFKIFLLLYCFSSGFSYNRFNGT